MFLRQTYLGTDISVVPAFPLHLRLQIGQLRDGHVDVAAAYVRGVSEVRRDTDHAPVYPELLPLLLRPAVPRPRRPLGHAARETLHPEFAATGHLAMSWGPGLLENVRSSSNHRGRITSNGKSSVRRFRIGNLEAAVEEAERR